jgi:hypothetical protein
VTSFNSPWGRRRGEYRDPRYQQFGVITVGIWSVASGLVRSPNTDPVRSSAASPRTRCSVSRRFTPSRQQPRLKIIQNGVVVTTTSRASLPGCRRDVFLVPVDWLFGRLSASSRTSSRVGEQAIVEDWAPRQHPRSCKVLGPYLKRPQVNRWLWALGGRFGYSDLEESRVQWVGSRRHRVRHQASTCEIIRRGTPECDRPPQPFRPNKLCAQSRCKDREEAR